MLGFGLYYRLAVEMIPSSMRSIVGGISLLGVPSGANGNGCCHHLLPFSLEERREEGGRG